MLEFPTSMMDRHLLSVDCGNVEMDLLNTHLESMKDHSEERERMTQLLQFLEIMTKFQVIGLSSLEEILT